MHEASERAIEQLNRFAPDMPLAAFKRAIGNFALNRSHHAEPPKSVRNSLDEIAALSMALYQKLASRSDELNAYLGEECVLFGDPMLPERLESELLRLSGLSKHSSHAAESHITKGRQRSPTTILIEELANALESAGEIPNARSSGPLQMAFGIALEELGLNVADPTDTVRKALRARERKEVTR